jgi:hypothetical protein
VSVVATSPAVPNSHQFSGFVLTEFWSFDSFDALSVATSMRWRSIHAISHVTYSHRFTGSRRRTCEMVLAFSLAPSTRSCFFAICIDQGVRRPPATLPVMCTDARPGAIKARFIRSVLVRVTCRRTPCSAALPLGKETPSPLRVARLVRVQSRNEEASQRHKKTIGMQPLGLARSPRAETTKASDKEISLRHH